ncbi:MAG: GNAT family N-acetyltransferase [Intrasporangium sp.]|uniref:GNAT family N-acetyltransferase n=1 Tax=Intrasporangium sp. TaxID=1925024 RepID=UPI002647720F|nr:GNAT family N-acetyltransferase [Intrasporangium sp.]MDN5797440.1 GNAT family N-acetyltransferase [Intrasporangium sp.]
MVRSPTHADAAAYAQAVTRSTRRLSDFAVPDPDNLVGLIGAQSPTFRTFLIHARDREGEHGIVGRVNVSNVARGSFRSATMGYDAYDPYAGRGLFAEGLEIVIDTVFSDEPAGMGLHRIEANIQPTNTRSAGLVRSLGFVHEGFSRDYLSLPSKDDPARTWRDHDRYAMLASDWPAVPYRPHRPHRMALVINGVPGVDGRGVANLVAAELSLPVFSIRTVPDPAVLWELLRQSSIGGVVECHVSPVELRIGLARSGLEAAQVPVIEPVADPSKREVVDIALRVRAAYP